MSDVLSHGADTAQGLMITAEAGDSILLQGMTLAKLQAHPEDFAFV